MFDYKMKKEFYWKMVLTGSDIYVFMNFILPKLSEEIHITSYIVDIV